MSLHIYIYYVILNDLSTKYTSVHICFWTEKNCFIHPQNSAYTNNKTLHINYYISSFGKCFFYSVITYINPKERQKCFQMYLSCLVVQFESKGGYLLKVIYRKKQALIIESHHRTKYLGIRQRY